MVKYYDGTKLLSIKDLQGNTPEIFICTSNRSGGKTTYFSRYIVNKFLKKNEKFMLIYRYKYELDSISDKFFKDIQQLFFNDYTMTSKSCAKGIYHELYLNDTACGYAVALNSADQLKKVSHLFSDTARMFFDEFQSETNQYCSDEIRKFISLHTTVARGQSKMVRYVPVIMCSNPVSIINPYYTKLGISERLKSDTKFLRGNGFVLEQGFVKSASEAQSSSGFNSAFDGDKYIEYAGQGVYLNDTKSFIEKMHGISTYIATIKFEGKEYSLKEFYSDGIIYCDTSVDSTFKNKLVVSTEDHEINYVMLKRNDVFISQLRYFFEKGCFRFKDIQCKRAVLAMISY